MAIETITRQDTRYTLLNRGKNPRFPVSAADSASRMEVCDTAEDTAQALERIVAAGLRPTVRSDGHCNEDFVLNNPDGVILDLGLLNETTPYPNDRYEGCHINYPDKDMLAYNFWPELYYGNQGLYPFLQGVKRRYDPKNVFHHAMSVRV
jgi:FAD/FMN-containing dehydrogenase